MRFLSLLRAPVRQPMRKVKQLPPSASAAADAASPSGAQRSLEPGSRQGKSQREPAPGPGALRPAPRPVRGVAFTRPPVTVPARGAVMSRTARLV